VFKQYRQACGYHSQPTVLSCRVQIHRNNDETGPWPPRLSTPPHVTLHVTSYHTLMFTALLNDALRNYMQHIPSRESVISRQTNSLNFTGPRTFITVSPTARNSSLSHATWIQPTPSHPIPLRPIITPPSSLHPGPPKWLISFGFHNQNCEGQGIFLSCKANARVKPAKMGHGPHSWIFVLFYVLCVSCRSVYCLCINKHCTTANGWLPNCSLQIYHIICSIPSHACHILRPSDLNRTLFFTIDSVRPTPHSSSNRDLWRNPVNNKTHYFYRKGA